MRLTESGRYLGALQVLRMGRHPFDRDALRLLGTLADLVAAAVEQQRLHGESLRQLTETRLLLDLARTTAGTLDLSGMLEVAPRAAIPTCDGNAAIRVPANGRGPRARR